MDYARSTICRADELQAGETIVRLGDVEYPDGLVLSARPLPLVGRVGPYRDRPLVALSTAGLPSLRVPADRLAWVAR